MICIAFPAFVSLSPLRCSLPLCTSLRRWVLPVYPHPLPPTQPIPTHPHPQKAGNMAGHSIATLLVEGTTLRQIGLGNLRVPNPVWLGKILPALSAAGNLVSADLSENYVTDDVCIELARQLPNIEKLKVRAFSVVRFACCASRFVVPLWVLSSLDTYPRYPFVIFRFWTLRGGTSPAAASRRAPPKRTHRPTHPTHPSHPSHPPPSITTQSPPNHPHPAGVRGCAVAAELAASDAHHGYTHGPRAAGAAAGGNEASRCGALYMNSHFL